MEVIPSTSNVYLVHAATKIQEVNRADKRADKQSTKFLRVSYVLCSSPSTVLTVLDTLELWRVLDRVNIQYAKYCIFQNLQNYSGCSPVAQPRSHHPIKALRRYIVWRTLSYIVHFYGCIVVALSLLNVKFAARTLRATSLLRDQVPRTVAMSKGISVGLSKGHVVTKRTLAPRPGSRKGVGLSPYCRLKSHHH